jgi:hypothetical protein
MLPDQRLVPSPTILDHIESFERQAAVNIAAPARSVVCRGFFATPAANSSPTARSNLRSALRRSAARLLTICKQKHAIEAWQGMIPGKAAATDSADGRRKPDFRHINARRLRQLGCLSVQPLVHLRFEAISG